MTLVPFLWAVLRRRPVIVAGVNPILPPLHGIFSGVLRWAMAKGRARDLFDEAECLTRLKEHAALIHMKDFFVRSENWMNRRFRFANVDDADPNGMAYKHTVCNYLNRKYLVVEALRVAQVELGVKADSIRGIDPDLASLHGALFGNLAAPHPAGRFTPSRLINAILALSMAALTIAWAVSRLRPFFRTGGRVFFAADCIWDRRDMDLYHEMSEGGRVLLVRRTKAFVVPEEGRGFETCLPNEGWFRLADLPVVFGLALGESLHLYLRHGWTWPSLFFKVAALVHKRVVLRAFFRRWPADNYYARDDYNAEHILRRQEIHRVGGRSLGVMHAIPGVAIIQPMWRYLNFDIYYLCSRAVYESYYKPTWAPDMTVRATGSFGVTRSMLAGRDDRRSEDIGVMVNIVVDQPELVRIVRALAKAFPDRRILLQMPPKTRRLARTEPVIAACRKNRHNVEHFEGNAYALFERAGIIFSDPSTVIGEAIQLGLTTFCLDLIPGHEETIFRNYPGLCVTQAEEAVARVRGVEDGTLRYPRSSLESLIDLSDRHILDVIRADVGLPELGIGASAFAVPAKAGRILLGREADRPPPGTRC